MDMDIDKSLARRPAVTQPWWRAIATDIHFWIPAAVLAAGLLLLEKLS
jgi:hypothetical protein